MSERPRRCMGISCEGVGLGHSRGRRRRVRVERVRGGNAAGLGDFQAWGAKVVAGWVVASAVGLRRGGAACKRHGGAFHFFPVAFRVRGARGALKTA